MPETGRKGLHLAYPLEQNSTAANLDFRTKNSTSLIMKTPHKTVFGLQFWAAMAMVVIFASGCISRRESRTYSFDTSDHRAASSETTRETTTAVQPAPQPAVTTASSGGGHFGYGSQLVTVTKQSPPTAAVGQAFENTIIVNPVAHIGNVELTHYVPANAQFVKAEPSPASVQGQKLVWNWKELKQADKRTVRVWIKPTAEGELRSCSTIHALPFGCIVTQVGKPSLTIEKTGPATAQVGEQCTYNIVVRNVGTSPAYKVEVVDTLPPGMSHESGKRELVFDAGDLQPGDAKQATVVLTASQRGTHVNSVTANSSNAASVSDTATTKVVQPGIKVVKTGPPQQFLGKTATYNITVSNTGDTTLEGVAVVDQAPNNAAISGAPGAQVAGQQATWSVGTLAPGQSKSFTLGLRASQPGVTVNRVTASANGGLSDSAQAETLWRGYAAVLVEMVDDPDPLLVGESTTYTLKVTNQGTAADQNVSVSVEFPAQVTPTAAGGVSAGTIQGNTVAFAPVASIEAKQVLTWTIKAKAAQVGDGRVTAKITTKLLNARPVTEVEATQVY